MIAIEFDPKKQPGTWKTIQKAVDEIWPQRYKIRICEEVLAGKVVFKKKYCKGIRFYDNGKKRRNQFLFEVWYKSRVYTKLLLQESEADREKWEVVRIGL